MTAEIALMNKEAIALAADSAVTFSVGREDRKIFPSANKIFTLSKYQPVGIMIYGSSMFMETPWETVIKVYRRVLGQKTFNTVEEYASDFLGFLSGNSDLFPESQQERYVEVSVWGYFYLIAGDINEELDQVRRKKGQISENEIKRTTSRHIKKHYDEWEKTPLIPSVTKRDVAALITKYRGIIDKVKKDIFQNITKTASQQLTKIAGNLLMKFLASVLSPQLSGIVIAGFGVKDIFPALQSFSVEGIANGILKHKENSSLRITTQTPAVIVPFAQKEMVVAFMEGVEPNYRQVMDGYLSRLFEQYPEELVDSIEVIDDAKKENLKKKLKKISKGILKKYQQALENYRSENYINPVITVVGSLPKDELAEMAESLVNLTKFKRKVSMQEETVGGPIDVAVISKGDGFIWIKRKHYFEAGLNPQFFSNYYRREEDGQE